MHVPDFKTVSFSWPHTHFEVLCIVYSKVFSCYLSLKLTKRKNIYLDNKKINLYYNGL